MGMFQVWTNAQDNTDHRCADTGCTRLCSYIEGIVRGYRNGLLTSANYTNMTQCETIDGEIKAMPPAISNASIA